MKIITDNLLKILFLKEKYIHILKIIGYSVLFLIVISNLFFILSFAQHSELKVSMLYFNNRTQQSDWDWLSKGLTDMLIQDLSRFDFITWSIRQDIENFYIKHNLSPSQTEINQQLLIRAEEDLDTDIIFFGNFYFSSSTQLIFSLKKYEVTNREIIAFRDIKVERTDIFKLKEKLALLILKELGVEFSSKDKALIEEAPTSSLGALINYYKCLDSRDRAIIEYKGVDYPSKQLWAQAIDYGEKAVALDPKYADAYYLLAEIYHRTHWTIREVESLNKFIQLVEDNHLENKRIYEQASQAYFRLGYAFYSKKEFDQAIEYFNFSIKYNPNLLDSHIYLVQAYYDKGEIGLALDACEEVLRIDPQNKEISWFYKKIEQSQKYGRDAYENYEKGYLAYKEGDFEKAIDYFKTSIFYNPGFKEPHYYLALSYYNIGDYDNSIFQWREVIKIDPFDNSAKHFLNRSLEEKKYGRETLRYFDSGYDYYIRGEYDKAVEEFNKALSYNPKYEKARQYLSRSYYQLNRMDKYREEREKAAELKISDEEEKAEEHYKLGYEFYSLNNYDVAIEELKKALNLKSNHPGARFLLGECYFKKEEYQLAQLEYERIINDLEKNEYTDDALLSSGWCLYLLGEHQQATEKFLKLINEFPESNLVSQATYKLSKSYFKIKDYSKTIKVCKEFLEKYPKFQGPEIEEIYFCLGQSYLGLEQYQEAEETFARLSSLYPDSPLIKEVEYSRSLSLFKLERYQEAIKILEELMAAEGEGRTKDETHYLLARCWLNLAEYNQAIKNLEDLKYNNKTEDSLLEKVIFDLGLAYSRKGDKEKAVLEFQEFIEKYPQSELIDSAHFELGKVLFNLKEYKLALSELKEISTAEALYLSGKAAEELGDREAEISILSELKEKFPESKYSQEAYFKLGNYYYNQKQYKEAIDEFMKLSQYFPHSSLLIEGYYWIGWSHFKLADYPKAIEYFKKVEEEEINLELAQRAMFMVAESLYNLKDYQNARKEYQNFIQKYPEVELSANAQYAIAWTYLENKEYKPSISEFKKLISLYPKSKFTEEAQFRIAKGYFLLGEKDRAISELKKFIDGNIKSNFRVEALYILSQIYLEEEKWMDSIIELERLIREYPKNRYLPDALYGLCLSYFKKDEYNKAIEIGEKYLKDYSKLPFGDDILYIKAICWENLENQEKAIADYQSLISTFSQSPYVEKAEERLEVLQKE